MEPTDLFEELAIDARNRIQTTNQMGFMFLNDNIVRQKLREYVYPGMVVADIGCAYGVDTIMLLEQGATVVAIDMNPDHLTVLLEKTRLYTHRLELLNGRFPEDFISAPLDAMLLSRVLIFLTPEEVQPTLQKAYNSLKAGAPLYIVTPSPYNENWEPIRKQFDLFRQKNPTDPYLAQNIDSLIPAVAPYLPEKILLFDTVALKHHLENCGFKIVTVK